MKKLFILPALLLFSLHVIAQKTYTLKRDTINLRGYVYNSDGTPAVKIVIQSKAPSLPYNRFYLTTATDSTGYFMLNGAKINDTLSIRSLLNIPNYYNHGSRYMIMYLPTPKIIDLSRQGNIVVTAIRKKPKVSPSFKIREDSFGCILDIEKEPEFVGGNERFITYIKQHLIYPEKAVNLNIEGEVKVQFTIERDGSLIHLRIIQGIGYGCDEEVTQIIKNSPKWSPGIAIGRPVAVDHSITIQFNLTN